jgi:hypothetical protein
MCPLFMLEQQFDSLDVLLVDGQQQRIFDLEIGCHFVTPTSTLQTVKMSTSKLLTIEMPTTKLLTIEMPTTKLPTIKTPKSKLTISKLPT